MSLAHCVVADIGGICREARQFRDRQEDVLGPAPNALAVDTHWSVSRSTGLNVSGGGTLCVSGSPPGQLASLAPLKVTMLKLIRAPIWSSM